MIDRRTNSYGVNINIDIPFDKDDERLFFKELNTFTEGC